jgi:hypothetical protein
MSQYQVRLLDLEAADLLTRTVYITLWYDRGFKAEASH